MIRIRVAGVEGTHQDLGSADGGRCFKSLWTLGRRRFVTRYWPEPEYGSCDLRERLAFDTRLAATLGIDLEPLEVLTEDGEVSL